MRVQLLHDLLEVIMHLGVLPEELLRVDWLGDVLLGPLPGLGGELLEFVLLQAGLHIKIIGHLFLHVFVFLKKTFGIFAVLQLFYLNYRYLVEQI